MVKLLTIDSAQSKDLDDAIWLSTRKDGFCLDVYIADVASEVPKDSPLDSRAREQAFSIYRGHRGCTNPMFPRELSEDRLSLLENQDRKVLGIHILLDANLEVESVNFSHVNITNAARLNPGLADELMDPTNTSEISSTLRLLKLVSKGLLDKRRAKGALAFYDINKRIYISEDGHLVTMGDDKAFHSQIIVQETMILANSTCAEYLVKNNLPALYRNHRVGSAAPASAALAADIDLALTSDDGNLLQNLSKRLNLVMSKATVDRVLYGHYALNLPAYAYFTSPIRRFPDLVNQRILLSHISGREPPYSSEELDQIASHYNARVLEEDEALSEKYRGLSVRASTLAISSNSLSKLDETEFYRVIRHLTKEQLEIPDNFYEEWKSRIKQNKVTAKLLAALIGGLGERLHEECSKVTIGFLRNNLSYGPSLWNILESKYGFSSPEVTTQGQGMEHGFTASAKGVIFDKPYCVECVWAKTKKEAQQKAYLELLTAFLGLPQEEHKKQPQIAAKAKLNPASGGDNYKGRLLELHVKAKKPQPQFTVDSFGEAHTKKFVCTITGGFDGDNRVKSGALGTKKDAEQSAARIYLETYFKDARNMIATAKVDIGGNPISSLQEYCQKIGLAVPEYTFEQEGVVFTCRVHLGAENRIDGKGQGNSKNLAKTNAATAALMKLKLMAN